MKNSVFKKVVSAVLSMVIVFSGMAVALPFMNVLEAKAAGEVSYDANYDIANGNVEIKNNGTYRIYGNGEAVQNRIDVRKDVNATIYLENVNIDVGRMSGFSAFHIDDDTRGNVTVILVGENTLKSGYYCAGLKKNGGEGTLEITGEGTLTATGGEYGAGIGGGQYGSGNNITISGGTVTAQGGFWGAGIGGGWRSSGSNITISGGTVTAQGGFEGAGIGGGSEGSGSNITISGGSVKASSISCTSCNASGKEVYKTIVSMPDNYTRTADGAKVEKFTVKQGYEVIEYGAPADLHGEDGNNFYLYLPKTEGSVEVNVKMQDGKMYGGLADSIRGDDSNSIKLGSVADFNVEDYNIADGNVEIKKGGVYRIYGNGEAVQNTIEVKKRVNATIYLENVYIDVSGTGNWYNPGTPAFKIADDSAGNVTVVLKGENTLKSGEKCAGLQKNGGTGTLEIASESDIYTLTAIGGEQGAGIGGGYNGDGNNITISGGEITAIGGEKAAGIGGGNGGNGNNITINGGDVDAKGGKKAAGIGGGNKREGRDIKISGGKVRTYGGEEGAGIGGGNAGEGKSITIIAGYVTAFGGERGAGIGGGDFAKGIDITASVKVTAVGGEGAENVGGGKGKEGENINIVGDSVLASR